MRLHRRLSSNQCDATPRLPLCLRLSSPEAKRALRGVACQDLVTTPIQPRRAVGHDHRPHHCPSLQSLFGATPQFCESVTPSSPRLRNRGRSYSVGIPSHTCVRLIQYLYGKGGGARSASSRSFRSKEGPLGPIAT